LTKDYYSISTTEKQIYDLKKKYEREKEKMAFNENNPPMYEHYKNRTKTIRMTLSMLGIHIDDVNR